MSKQEVTIDTYYKQEAEACKQIKDSLESFRKAYNNGEITDEMLKQIGDDKGIAHDELIKYCKMSRLEMEENPYYKSDLTDTYTYCPTLKDGETFPDDFVGREGYENYDFSKMDLKITRHGDTYHCESKYLGTFDYHNDKYNADGSFRNQNADTGLLDVAAGLQSISPTNVIMGGATGAVSDGIKKNKYNDWRVGYKVIEEDDGTKSFLPVFEYDGEEVCITPEYHVFWTSDREDTPTGIPEGLKSLDYTFSKKSGLELMPQDLPSSLTSMHCAFSGCSRVTTSNLSSNTLTIPDSVVDVSGAFKNCSHLQGKFVSKFSDGTTKEQLPSQTVSAVSCFEGCEKLDDSFIFHERYNGTNVWYIFGSTKWFANKEGERADANVNYDITKMGEGYTPYLSAEYAKGVFDSIADTNGALGRVNKFTQDIKNVKFNVNAGNATDTTGLDETKLDSAQAASTQVRAGQLIDGHVITNQELMTDGAITTDHRIMTKDANGNNVYVDDGSGAKDSEKNKYLVRSNPLEKGLLWGAIGAGASLITKKRLVGAAVGIAGFFASEHVSFLPTSFYPIVKFTIGFIPDGIVKDKLTEWSHTLSGYTEELNKDIDKLNSEIRENNKFYDNPYNVGNLWKEKRLSRIFSESGTGINDGFDTNLYMKNNAKKCSEEMTFIAAAMAECDGQSAMNNVSSVIGPTMFAVTSKWKADITPENATEEQRQTMQTYYLGMMSALESYNKGAKEGNNEYYAKNDLEKDLSNAGLNIVNRAYTEQVISSLKEMDGMYHFMDDTSWDKISKMDISGVDIQNIKNYNATYMSSIAQKEQPALAYMQECFTKELEADTVRKWNDESKDLPKSVSDYKPKKTKALLKGETYVEEMSDAKQGNALKNAFSHISGMPESAKHAASEAKNVIKTAKDKLLDATDSEREEDTSLSSPTI